MCVATGTTVARNEKLWTPPKLPGEVGRVVDQTTNAVGLVASKASELVGGLVSPKPATDKPPPASLPNALPGPADETQRRARAAQMLRMLSARGRASSFLAGAEGAAALGAKGG